MATPTLPNTAIILHSVSTVLAGCPSGTTRSWRLILHPVLMLHKMASFIYACEKRPSESLWFALQILVFFVNVKLDS